MDEYLKYEKEIDELLRFLFYEKCMDDKDYKEIIEETFRFTGITKQKLCEDLEIGVKNGFSVESQILLLKELKFK